MKASDRLFALVGPLFMLGLVVYHASLLGTQWEFGRYYMPRTLTDESGFARPDGTPLDSFTMMMVHSGIEEEAELLMFCILIAVLTMFALVVRQGVLVRKRLAASRAELDRWESQRGRRHAERCIPR